MPIGPMSQIRYLKQDNLKSIQRIQANYFKEIIDQFGVVVDYFKHDITYPEQFRDTYENYVYGEANELTYSLSAKLPIYLEFDNDAFILNQYGIQPQQNAVLNVMIDEFNFQFPERGTPTNLILNTTSATSEVSAGSAIMSYPITADSGFISGEISGIFALSGYTFTTSVSGITNIQFYNYNDRVAVNSDIKLPLYYDYIKTHFSNFIYTYSGNVDVSGNGSVSGTLSGLISYNKLSDFDDFRRCIKPEVGDYIRLPFFDDNHEEYILTNVRDRALTPNGVNPLLNKYLWICDLVRRDYSEEDTTKEEHTNTDVINIDRDKQEDISDIEFDYTNEKADRENIDKEKSDRMYGGYSYLETSTT